MDSVSPLARGAHHKCSLTSYELTLAPYLDGKFKSQRSRRVLAIGFPKPSTPAYVTFGKGRRGSQVRPRSRSRSPSYNRGTWVRARRGSLRTGQSQTRGPPRATRWLPPAPGSGRPSAPGARPARGLRWRASPGAPPRAPNLQPAGTRTRPRFPRTGR